MVIWNHFDEWRLGPQTNLPTSEKNNPGRNHFYMLPFILGLIGLVYHYNKNNKDAWVVSLLFIFTGLAIVVVLNQYPYQPRERDYVMWFVLCLCNMDRTRSYGNY